MEVKSWFRDIRQEDSVENMEYVDSWQICSGEKGNQAFISFTICDIVL
jgi:hypothetical protein